MNNVKKKKRAKAKAKPESKPVQSLRVPTAPRIASYLSHPLGEMLRSYVVSGIGYDGKPVVIKYLDQEADGIAMLGIIDMAAQDLQGDDNE